MKSEMKDLLFRLGAGVLASLTGTVAYLLSPDLAIALGIAVMAALLVAAFVAKPIVLVGGVRSRQSFLVPVLLATSMAFSAVGSAISERPSMVLAFVLGLVALVVLLARSAVDASLR